MARENKSKYAVLGMLAVAPMSGYDIKKKFESGLETFWRESYGQIYPILGSLVKGGLAERKVEEQAGRPDRHVYSITPQGREVFVTWLKQSIEPESFRIEILLKLIFGRMTAPADNIRHVEEYREKYRCLDERLKSIESHMRSEHQDAPSMEYVQITLSYGRHLAGAMLAWCDETLAVLNKEETDGK